MNVIDVDGARYKVLVGPGVYREDFLGHGSEFSFGFNFLGTSKGMDRFCFQLSERPAMLQPYLPTLIYMQLRFDKQLFGRIIDSYELPDWVICVEFFSAHIPITIWTIGQSRLNRETENGKDYSSYGGIVNADNLAFSFRRDDMAVSVLMKKNNISIRRLFGRSCACGGLDMALCALASLQMTG